MTKASASSHIGAKWPIVRAIDAFCLAVLRRQVKATGWLNRLDTAPKTVWNFDSDHIAITNSAKSSSA